MTNSTLNRVYDAAVRLDFPTTVADLADVERAVAELLENGSMAGELAGAVWVAE